MSICLSILKRTATQRNQTSFWVRCELQKVKFGYSLNIQLTTYTSLDFVKDYTGSE